MDAHEVAARVRRSMNSTTNRDGWDFQASLVNPPKLQEFIDDHGNLWNLWLVLQENQDPKGYQVFYDPEADQFGLAHEDVAFGWYGDFMETIDAM